MIVVNLSVLYESLAVGENLMIYMYPSGDCDTFRWPLDTTFRSLDQQREQIASAAYDMREIGLLPVECTAVRLPDDSVVELEG